MPSRYLQLFVLLFPVLVATLALSTTSIAQENGINREVLSSIRDSAVVARSSTDFEKIPKHKLYYSVFLKAILNPAFSEAFSVEDWEMIRNLPSHGDIQFTRQARDSLLTACQKIDLVRGEDVAASIEIARIYEGAKREINKFLDLHYERVYHSLSGFGKETVNNQLEVIAREGSLAYADIDFEVLSTKAPSFSLQLLKTSCANVPFAPALNTEKSVLLRDEISESMAGSSRNVFNSVE